MYIHVHSFISIANQKSVRYSFSKSYFTNIEFQNVNIAFVYITDRNPSFTFCDKAMSSVWTPVQYKLLRLPIPKQMLQLL